MSNEVEEEEKILLPVSVVLPTHLGCVTRNVSGRLRMCCDLLSYESYVKRVRVEDKNVLEVEQSPCSVELIKAVFQTARELGCDHVRMHIPDIMLCI